MSIVDDISLKANDGDVENIDYEICNLRRAILQTLCLENFYEKEADHEKRGVESRKSNETFNHDKLNVFEVKIGLNL